MADTVQSIYIADTDCLPLCWLHADAPLLLSAIETQKSKIENPPGPLLLAPRDPLIYEWRVSATLWDLDYTWEVYTPPAKRVRGYYALHVLAATELVGLVDPKVGRDRRKLCVVSRRIRRGHAVAPAGSASAPGEPPRAQRIVMSAV